MSQSKPLIMPWLKDQINSGLYPGVAWTNADETEFCIPWKHALRQDSSSDDILIFKAWAEVNRERAHGDHTVWKRNFRSALRAKGFQMLSDNKNDGANPHKVFRWPETSSTASPSDGSQDSEIDLYREPFPVQESGATGWSNPYFVDGTVFIDSNNQDILKKCMEELNIRNPDLVLQPEYQPRFGDLVEGDLFPYQQPNPMEGAMGGVNRHPALEQPISCVPRPMSGENINTSFRVVVYYRGMKVSEQLVENESGFKLIYIPNLTEPQPDTQTGLSLVSLPGLGHLTDRLQTEMTQRILDSLGEGLEVRRSGSVFLGQRMGGSRAYWSLCKFDNSKRPQEVSKFEPTVLYQARYFFEGLQQFIQRSGGECPSFSLFFCLGERWPDPDGRPWEKKLVVVEVVLTALEILKLFAVDGGASSLQSVELQLSLQEMMELC